MSPPKNVLLVSLLPSYYFNRTPYGEEYLNG